MVSVIFANLNSSIVFKIRWIHYVSAVLKFNQLHISCSTVPFTTMISTLPSSSLTFRQTIECGFTLKLARDMIITYSQMKFNLKIKQCISMRTWLISHSHSIFPFKIIFYFFVFFPFWSHRNKKQSTVSRRLATNTKKGYPNLYSSSKQRYSMLVLPEKKSSKVLSFCQLLQSWVN